MDFFVKYIKIFVIFCGIFGYNYALRKPSRFLFDFFSAYFQILCAISQILVYTDLCLLALDQGDWELFELINVQDQQDLKMHVKRVKFVPFLVPQTVIFQYSGLKI